MNKPRLRAAITSAVLAMAVAGMSVIGAPSASAAPKADPSVGTLTSTVTGTFTDAAGQAGTFTGNFTPSQFADGGQNVTSTGLLTGTLTDSTGATQNVSQTQTFAVQDILPAASCQVLDLNLAPLDLNLLGLVVHLDRVHLNITAVPGAGNLLGNLICALTGLLDGAGTLAQISALLNQILALLGLLGV
jgi:hypothetical protein